MGAAGRLKFVRGPYFGDPRIRSYGFLYILYIMIVSISKILKENNLGTIIKI